MHVNKESTAGMMIVLELGATGAVVAMVHMRIYGRAT